MRFEERVGLREFLSEYPGMRVEPSLGGELRLAGVFAFRADYEAGPVIEDSYEIFISVPNRFPKELPTVKETGGRIPRNANSHVNPDQTLCLGSPLRLRKAALCTPTVAGFAANAIVPFLYAASHRTRFAGPLPFGELAHGTRGELDDYADLIGLRGDGQVLQALSLLGMKRRVANKRPCPCGCKRRLGVCRFNAKVRLLRAELGRQVFREVEQRMRQELAHAAGRPLGYSSYSRRRRVSRKA